MEFDGGTDAINLASAGSIDSLNGAAGAAMMAWVNNDGNDDDTYISLSIGGVATDTERCLLGGQGKGGNTENESRAPDGGAQKAVSVGGPATNTWVLLGLRTNVAGDAIYVDQGGVQLASSLAVGFGAGTFSATNSASGALMAMPKADSKQRDGEMDDARIYNRFLSQNEIQTIHACRGHDGIRAGLSRNYRLFEGAPGVVPAVGNVIQDYALDKVNVAKVNAPTYQATTLSYRRRFA